MEFEKTPEIRSINYMKKVKLRVERGKSGYLPLLDKIRSLGWVALSDKLYRKNGVVHFRQKLVDPDSEETWDIP